MRRNVCKERLGRLVRRNCKKEMWSCEERHKALVLLEGVRREGFTQFPERKDCMLQVWRKWLQLTVKMI